MVSASRSRSPEALRAALIPRERRSFQAGLVAFLLAHVAYTLAFAQHADPLSLPPAGLLLIGLASLVLYLYFRPHLGRMKAPVAAYVAVITAMLVAASIARDEQGLIVRMEVKSIPERLSFNQRAVGENEMEYRWAVFFDLEGDGRDDYCLDLVRFKDPQAGNVTGGLIENVQCSLWRLKRDGAEFVDIRIRGSRNGGELILDVPACDFVASLGERARIRFQTYYTDGKSSDADDLPD